MKSDLDDLEQKIKQAKGEESQPQDEDENLGQGMEIAGRIVTDLFAGIAVGGVIGWFIDNYFNSLPLFLIICLLLGGAGGAMNIYRSFNNQQQ